ncbi:RsmB/NOP family class I SAM-dependent RNA methyltransferase [Sphingomonas baiyangensis]|uniref:RsmB/NOP family class I SAM-dependent RNA methyltransferase n=1 Tax=Sphingomonas baiyangensis TaxID=2572576 RepID=A0A4U1L409_9SPHN|nr:RsmB/NOP family class I SAM-dependent RNA methyltransferase [Sphingomonas baiyangensis]TKD50875.1 RsmB/NOP family class I SAM-dependent RNA methyltransferase [Sphingomonas baiyangensis]
MTPAARVQSAIELLDAIIEAARGGGAAADTIIARWFATRRYAGSKDRRAIREHVYAAIRLCGEVPPSGRAAMLALADRDDAIAQAFDGSPYGPQPATTGEPRAAAGIAPDWLAALLIDSGVAADEQAALLDRAPFDIRRNVLKSVPLSLQGEPIAFLNNALRLPPDTQIEASDDWREGRIEVQDAGSQWVALACAARPGEHVIDLCAGAGGKTLALAAAMENSGTLIAADTDRTRLQRLPPRAERAGVTIARTRLLNPGREAEALADCRDAADLVLVDAPCSGTGTWRRNPEARWRLTPERLARLTATQARLLDVAAALVRPGGRLVHVVCSLLDAEGADQIEAFLARHAGWRAVPIDLPVGTPHRAGLRLTPAAHSTDGFFVAMMQRS